MEVRPGGPEDLDAVVALVSEADRDRGHVLAEETLRALLTEATVLVAEADGEIMGYIGVHRAEGPSASIGMSVARAWRSCGVGTALIEAVVAWAAEQRLERLTLEVLSDNAPARALYRKTGFVEDGRRRSAGGHVVSMSRLLSPSS